VGTQLQKLLAVTLFHLYDLLTARYPRENPFMSHAPRAKDLPLFPASWYWFGPARSLRHDPVSRDLLGYRLTAHRGASGEVVVQHPPFAQLCSYPTTERHGHLFLFNGPEPLFPLPFFADSDPADYVVARPLHFHAEGPWYMVNANSFDVQHFRACHNRELLGEAQVDSPHPFARRIRLSFRVVGASVLDRLLRRFIGERVEVTMTNWGASTVVITADFLRARSTLIAYSEPLTEQTCVEHVFVHARRSRLGAPVEFPRLFVRRLFTHGFMAEEFDTLAGIRYVPESFLSCDHLMVEFFQWVAQLPQTAAAEPEPETSPRSEHISLCKETVS
jgi:phenylpropionate dioxygenase-like ring-hydroxylating dioxygenase large terminal subunit